LLTVTDIHGCTGQQVKEIYIEEAFVMVPNAFTPDGNGMNDYFFPSFNYLNSMELWIFNKWGEAIYHQQGIEGPGWDGTYRGQLSPAGNYVYKMIYETPDGRKMEETKVFSLIR
jgi:large repetitive protein